MNEWKCRECSCVNKKLTLNDAASHQRCLGHSWKLCWLKQLNHESLCLNVHTWRHSIVYFLNLQAIAFKWKKLNLSSLNFFCSLKFVLNKVFLFSWTIIICFCCYERLEMQKINKKILFKFKLNFFSSDVCNFLCIITKVNKKSKFLFKLQM